MENEDKAKENISQDEIKKDNENGIGNSEESQIEQNGTPIESYISLSQVSTIKNDNELIRENSQNFFQYNKSISIGEMNNKESSLDSSIISKIKGDEIEK